MSTSCLILEYILLILLKVTFPLVKFAGLSLVMEDFLHFLKVCTEFCLCCVTSSHPLFVSDPSVSRYHVQWMPEYCSHNETRGPEKSVTQVSQKPGKPGLCTASKPRFWSQSAACTELRLDHQPRRYAKHVPDLFVWCFQRTAPAKENNSAERAEALLRWICTGQITGCCFEYYESVVWSGMWCVGQ